MSKGQCWCVFSAGSAPDTKVCACTKMHTHTYAHEHAHTCALTYTLKHTYTHTHKQGCQLPMFFFEFLGWEQMGQTLRRGQIAISNTSYHSTLPGGAWQPQPRLETLSCSVMLRFCNNHKGSPYHFMQFSILPADPVEQVAISRACFAADSCSFSILLSCSRFINAGTGLECM